MPYDLARPADEDAAYARLERLNQTRTRARLNTDRRTAQLLGDLRAHYPQMSPGTLLGLARANVAPGSKVAERAAEAEGLREMEDGGGGFLDFGAKVVSAPFKAAGKAISSVADVVDDPIRAGLRTTFTALGAPIEEFTGRVGELVSSAGEPLAEIATVGGAVAGGAGGFALGGPAGAAAGAAAGGGLGGLLGDIIGGGETQTFSRAGEAVRGIASGEGSQLGHGFFPGGEASVRQAETMRELGRKAGLGNQGFTIGRYFTNSVLEPGTLPYNVASGIVDASAQVFGDPSAVGLKSLGAYNAGRKLILAEQADAWLNSEKALPVLRAFADERDWERLWRLTGRGKIDKDTVNRLIDAEDVDAVKAILAPELGVGIRETPSIPTGARGVISRGAEQPLLFGKSVHDVRMFGTVPGNLIDTERPGDAINQIDRFLRNAKIDRTARSTHLERFARAETKEEIYQAVRGVMSDVQARLIAEGSDPSDAANLTTMYLDRWDEASQYFVDSLGNGVRVPGYVDNGSAVALAEPHLYAEALARILPLPDHRAIRQATSKIGRWREAHPVGELPLVGMEWFTQQAWKPFALIRGAWTVRVVGEEQVRMAAVGNDSLFRHPLSWLGYVTGRKGGTDIFGKTFDLADDTSDYHKALSRVWAGWRDKPQGVVLSRGTARYHPPGSDSYNPALYARAWADELSTLASDPIATKVAKEGPEAVKGWFFDGAGQKFRNELMENPKRAGLANRSEADAYIDSVAERIRIKTGDNADLVEKIAGGKFTADEVFRADLRARAEAGGNPGVLKGDKFYRGLGEDQSKYDRAVDAMFSALMGKPTNRLSRSPAFKQFYERRIDELSGAMDSGRISKADADELAKAFALDETKALLYDLSERSQFFDIARAIFPFGEAWKEVLTVWARIGTEQPQIFRRFQQGIEGARGAGFFYTNENGEEVFTYPGSQFLTEKLVGVPIPLEGRVQGLSLATEVLPGFGPAVTLPAAYVVPETPDFETFSEILFPFGRPDRSVLGGVGGELVPAWLRKWQTAGEETQTPEQQRQFANTVMHIASYLVTKRGRPQDEIEMRELVDEAKSKAKRFWMVRGMIQWGAPTAPSPKWMAEDKDGSLVVAQRLREEYQELVQKVGPQVATDEFLGKHGDQAFLLTQAMSNSLVYAAPVTKAGIEWAQRNKDIRDALPNTYGLFAPVSNRAEDFEYDAYIAQFSNGTREALSPKQFLELANNRIARNVYEEAKVAVGPNPNPQQRSVLSALQDALRREYPGYNPGLGGLPGLAKKATFEQAIIELEKAVTVPGVADTPAGQGLALYLQARDVANERAAGLGLKSFAKSKKTRGLRDVLRILAGKLSEEYEGFGAIFDQVLSREMDDDFDEPLLLEAA